jgi:uroporphyrinogen-III synthase
LSAGPRRGIVRVVGMVAPPPVGPPRKGHVLAGKRVLVTRAAGERPGGLAALLREVGAEPVVVPTIELVPPADPGALQRALADLRAGAYGWVAFTSANAVERTWDALPPDGRDVGVLGGARLAAIGPVTSRALELRGLRPEVVAGDPRGEGLAEAMLAAIRGTAPTRILLPRAAQARQVLPEALRAAGHRVDVVVAYESRAPAPGTLAPLTAALEQGQIDAVTFTSGSTVDNLCDLLGDRAVEWLGRCRIATIGPVTSDVARARGLRVDVMATDASVAGLVRALVDSYSR